MPFLIPVAIAILPADIGFINFHFPQQLRKAPHPSWPHESDGTYTKPCGNPHSDLAMDLQGADALLALRHQVNDLEPCPQRIIGILENRLGDNREAIAVPSPTLLCFADPVKRTRFQQIDFSAVAARTLDALCQRCACKTFARLFGREAFGQLRQGHGGFDLS